MKDYVRCYNCEFIGTVKIGSDTCPKCGVNGYLGWADDNMQEVPDNFKVGEKNETGRPN